MSYDLQFAQELLRHKLVAMEYGFKQQYNFKLVDGDTSGKGICPNDAETCKELDQARKMLETAKDFFVLGALSVADRDSNLRFTESEMAVAADFMKDNYLKLLNGCLKQAIIDDVKAPGRDPFDEAKAIGCIERWLKENVATKVAERNSRPWWSKVGHFFWDLITNW